MTCLLKMQGSSCTVPTFSWRSIYWVDPVLLEKSSSLCTASNFRAGFLSTLTVCSGLQTSSSRHFGHGKGQLSHSLSRSVAAITWAYLFTISMPVCLAMKQTTDNQFADVWYSDSYLLLGLQCYHKLVLDSTATWWSQTKLCVIDFPRFNIHLSVFFVTVTTFAVHLICFLSDRLRRALAPPLLVSAAPRLSPWKPN